FFHLLAIGEDEPVEVTQRFLNRNFYEADLSGPSYRHGLLVRTAVEGPHPEGVVAPLTARAAASGHADADLSLLSVVLTESLVASTQQAVAAAQEVRDRLAQATAAREATAEAERQTRAHNVALEAAHAADAAAMASLQAAHNELAAFRDAVMAHPAMRVRNLARRLLGR
ncbi:MAG TPA: hypothetical protein VMM13_11520, partial [Euzebya sp.]|nr:hypothetical protein [Euzebya sp.]